MREGWSGYSLFAGSGGHTGEVEGKAIVIGTSAKYYKVEDLDTCILKFTLKGNTILIKQERGQCSAAMGVFYTGTYHSYKSHKKEQSETLYHLGVFKSKRDDSLFRRLVKNYYDLFLNSAQLTSEDDDLDNLNSKVFSSGVRGLYTQMESIIMINSNKDIWAAVIDNSGKKEKVLYL